MDQNVKELLNALETATEGINEAIEGMSETDDMDVGEIETDESTGAPKRMRPRGKVSSKASQKKAKEGAAKAAKNVQKAKAIAENGLDSRVTALERSSQLKANSLGAQATLSVIGTHLNPAAATVVALRSRGAAVKLVGIRLTGAQESGTVTAITAAGNPINGAPPATEGVLVGATNGRSVRDVWFNEPILVDSTVGVDFLWTSVAGAILTAVVECEGLSSRESL